MRFQFFLVPAAIIASLPAPAQAKVFMNIKQAQALMFPRVKLTPQPLTLTDGEAQQLARSTPALMHDGQIKAWRAPNGGWFILDQVEGKGDWITYALALDATGSVRQIEILECLADYDTITMPEWRAQFIGRKHGDGFADVEMISGSTLSSRHVTEGVKRVLAAHALYLKSENP